MFGVSFVEAALPEKPRLVDKPLPPLNGASNAGLPLDDGLGRSEPGKGRAARPLAIRIKDASIQYPLGNGARGSLKSTLLSLIGGRKDVTAPAHVDAIHRLNLDIAVGDRVALIGHNGSGKSTLLRALAGVYPPTGGTIEAVGRIGALLDISLGFEGESTGRENIYFRGMVLGYSRKEIAVVEKEIVKFADLGEFIDYPVRTYSAGMFVRLGFAVSTQFSPEILLVDEVFGAGDASFAQKALARMREIVARAGILVLATHDMPLVQQICNRVVWLERGVIRAEGDPDEVVGQYYNYLLEQQAQQAGGRIC